MAHSDSEKLRNIDYVIGRWLEPEGGLTSYQAMMEVLAAMDGVPVEPDPAAGDAELRRWKQDRPHHDPVPTSIKVIRPKFFG